MDLLSSISFATIISTFILCLCIYAIAYVIRNIVESIWLGAKQNRYWSGIFLSVSGIANGAILAILLPFFPWPEFLGGYLGNRVVYGVVCGLFSSFMYGRVKAWLKSKTKLEGEVESNTEIEIETKTEIKIETEKKPE